MRIRNINEDFGESVEFEASTETECKISMAQALIACGNEISAGKTTDEMVDILVEGADYEIVND